MLPHWKHLLLGQRKSIANMLAQGWRLKRIASVIGMDPTSSTMRSLYLQMFLTIWASLASVTAFLILATRSLK